MQWMYIKCAWAFSHMGDDSWTIANLFYSVFSESNKEEKSALWCFLSIRDDNEIIFYMETN